MDEAKWLLDKMLICPIIDGERFVLAGNAALEEIAKADLAMPTLEPSLEDLAIQAARYLEALSLVESRHLAFALRARVASTRPTPAAQMDWQQVVLNGGPPCFALLDDEEGWYCGRAQRWVGHDGEHKFISLQDLLGVHPAAAGDAARPSAPATDDVGCEWTYKQWKTGDMWKSECGHVTRFESDGSLKDRMSFCCFCGKPLVERKANG